ncbi:MAG: Tfp pilus assembly protein PilF [Arenicella sp.]|jgi:Tfp pilus assembly protein PilF
MINLIRTLLVAFLLVPASSFLQEKEDLTALTDSLGSPLNVFDAIDNFPEFDAQINDLKEDLFKEDSLVQTHLLSFIPIKNPDPIHLHMYAYLYARVYNEKPDFKSAAYFYHLAYRYAPEQVEMIDFEVGSCFYLCAELDSAKKYLTIFDDKFPNNSAAITNLGFISIDQGDAKLAAKYFKRAYKLNPNHPGNINNYGYALYLIDRLDEAKDFILMSKKINPNNPFVYRNLGLIYGKKGKTKKACKYLQLSIEKGMLTDWGEQYLTDLRAYCNE